MTGFSIDPTAVGRLATTVRKIHGDLECLADADPLDAGETGHSRLADSVHDFVGKWEDGRRELRKKIDDFAARLDQAVGAYTGTEGEVVQTFGGPR
ncbi:hypothetical protein AB0F15_39455 [Amycolatopsis sp. NPDC026612]|uniref:WXG100 family type VII secretion target n=1 Tax=Amycolatopsis sp. NPDC026612 TaxID=3155466 RepID=UPI0033E774A6